MRSTYAIIDLDALAFNYTNLKNKAGGRDVIAVVKADAYGHGMIKCVKKLESLEDKPAMYGVALLEEAITLAEEMITSSPILCFAPFDSSRIRIYQNMGIIPTICTPEHIQELNNISLKSDLVVHINIDTGMGRLGIRYEEYKSAINKLANSKVKIGGVYTHFATSDDSNKTYANKQFSKFKEVIKITKKAGYHEVRFHCANSGAVIDLRETHLDMIRPGMALYGYNPSLETSESVELKPVMSLVSKVSSLREVKAGESVSYGQKYFADKDTIAATLPLGYADGVYRGLSNKIRVICNGHKLDQIGRITMDRILFNTEEKNISRGDEVILLGSDGKNRVDAWEWAKIIDTIPYEITCNISKRVLRKYVNE